MQRSAGRPSAPGQHGEGSLRKRQTEMQAAAPDGVRGDWRVLGRLLPHLWPKNEPALRQRMVVSVVLLLFAKVATVYVPIFYKSAVDALSVPATITAVPVLAILAYGLARVGTVAFNELRDLVFARVVERAMHVVGLDTFRHLHALSLRFHMDRQTGGLSRVVERGTRGIEIVLRLFAFRAGPAVIELVMVCAILWWMYDWTFAAAIVGHHRGLYPLDAGHHRLAPELSPHHEPARRRGQHQGHRQPAEL